MGMKSNVIIAIVTITVIILILYVIHNLIVRSHGTADHHNKKDGKDKNGEDNDDGKITYEDSYTITVGKKSKDNRFRDIGSRDCFYINGVEAPRMILRRSVYYRFVNESDEPFYFTSHSDGGHVSTGVNGEVEMAVGNLSKNVKAFKGLTKGTIYFMVSDDLPDSFYYQSSISKNMGSTVILGPQSPKNT